jgi:hypothetical protein
MPQDDHWLPGFKFNVEEWDAKGQSYETLAICPVTVLSDVHLCNSRPGRRRPSKQRVAPPSCSLYC